MFKRLLLIGSAVAMLLPVASQAQTVVTETSSGDLMVVEFRGKPPHKRRFISPDNAEQYARYAQMLESVSVMVASESTRRAGPPGKMTASRSTSTTLERVPAESISQFARFEESEESAEGNQPVRRGPPGKGIFAR